MTEQEERDLLDKFALTFEIPWNALMSTLSLQDISTPTIQQMFDLRAMLAYTYAKSMIAERKKIVIVPGEQ